MLPKAVNKDCVSIFIVIFTTKQLCLVYMEQCNLKSLSCLIESVWFANFEEWLTILIEDL